MIDCEFNNISLVIIKKYLESKFYQKRQRKQRDDRDFKLMYLKFLLYSEGTIGGINFRDIL